MMATTEDCKNCKMELRGEFKLQGEKVHLKWGHDHLEIAKFMVHVYAIIETHNEKSWVRYVGETTNSLDTRMYQYRNGNKNQPTNHKVNNLIRTSLEAGHGVVLYSLLDDIPVTWAGKKINLAKGIESALIAAWQPGWNGSRGKKLELVTRNGSKNLELVKILYNE